MTSFAYRPLSPGKSSTRLVRLLSDQGNEPATKASAVDDSPTAPEPTRLFTMFETPLSQSPPYVALSYVWGDASPKRPILLDGVCLHVSENLEAAMHQLPRDSDGALTVWIDALCINQDDAVEKAEQIRHMKQIFSRATAVFCWLGPAADNSDIAMRWIDCYGRRASELGIGLTPEMRLIRLLKVLDAGPDKIADEGVREFLLELKRQLSWGSHGVDSLMMALSGVFQRRYRSRIWVVQEVAKGTTIRFICGDVTVPEDHLHHALRLVRNFAVYQDIHPEPGIEKKSTASLMATMNPINLLKVRRSSGPFELIYLLRILWNYEASDYRDKIFAILGLASDADDLGLRPNYFKTAWEVFVDTAVALLADGYIDLLSLCESYTDRPDVPSWVPDFSRRRERRPLQERSLVRNVLPMKSVLQPTFLASGNKHPAVLFPSPEKAGPLHIRIMATPLGAVSAVGDPWGPESPRRWLSDLDKISTPLFGPAGSERLRAVLRTAVADQEVRQADKKPRLSADTIQELENLLGAVDLGDVGREMLTSFGLKNYYRQMESAGAGRRPFAAGRLLGIGPAQAGPGDVIYVLEGGTVPYVLRADPEGKTRLVGEAFVYGMMDGEAMDGSPAFVPIAIY